MGYDFDEFGPTHEVTDIEGTVHRYAITDDERPSTILALALCDLKDVTPDAMDPLYHHVDLDALDKLVAPDCSPSHPAECSVIISLEPYWISVNEDAVVIWRVEEDEPREAFKWR